MPTNSNLNFPSKPAFEKADRSNPAGFVLSIALTLFGLTLLAVVTMHLAVRFGWQLF